MNSFPLSLEGKVDSPLFERFAQQFYEEHLGLIPYGCHRYSISQDQALDAYSDSVADVLSQVRTGKFRKECALDTYLFRLFNNRCIKFLRNRQAAKRAGVQLPLGDSSSSDPTPYQQLEDKDAIIHLKAICQELNPRLWQILEELFLKGSNLEEIALKLGFKTPASVASIKWRHLKQLQQSFHHFSYS
ncbi:MAG: sigma-70 family RNA polymerase sigma factor [Bacteroidota bacterium]